MPTDGGNDTAPDGVDAAPDKTGWLWRKWKKGGVRRKWVREYAVLRGSFLYMYSGEEQRSQKLLVPIKDVTTQIFVHHKRMCTFELLHDERRGICFDGPPERAR